MYIQYSYKLKILGKGSKPVVRQVHRLKSKVSSITQLKASLIDEFSDEVPNTLEFDVGWLEGNSKKWLVVQEDLNAMFSKRTGNEISLWCDVSRDDSGGDSGGRKRKNPEQGGSTRKDKEDAVESIYQELLAEHMDVYSKPQLRLWARMISCGTHDDYTDPPRVPLITGTAPKRQKTDTLSDAVTDAAKAVVRAFSPPLAPPTTPPAPPTTGASAPIGISPGKSVDLRGKNLEQLRYVQQLYEDNILTATEYKEQKDMILDAIRHLK